MLKKKKRPRAKKKVINKPRHSKAAALRTITPEISDGSLFLLDYSKVGSYYEAKLELRQITGAGINTPINPFFPRPTGSGTKLKITEEKALPEFIPKTDTLTFEVLPLNSTQGYFELSTNGLTTKQFNKITKFWPFTDARWANFLGISKRTFLRRIENQQTFSEHETSQILSIIDLVHFGFHVFNDEENFFGWLTEPIMALKWNKPIDYLTNTYGIDIVQKIMGRILYGIHT